jgi:hypothetical protein
MTSVLFKHDVRTQSSGIVLFVDDARFNQVFPVRNMKNSKIHAIEEFCFSPVLDKVEKKIHNQRFLSVGGLFEQKPNFMGVLFGRVVQAVQIELFLRDFRVVVVQPDGLQERFQVIAVVEQLKSKLFDNKIPSNPLETTHQHIQRTIHVVDLKLWKIVQFVPVHH